MGSFKALQGQLVAAHPGMAKTFEVGHLAKMRIPLQLGKLIQHLLETGLGQRLIEVRQPCLRCVVIRPGSRRWRQCGERRLGKGLLSRCQLLLKLDHLLLQPSNLLMAIPQLLERINECIAFNRSQGFSAVLRRRERL